ncbi:MAG TPA: phage virion morphogenesis protein [Blastocatellia bacterium]
MGIDGMAGLAKRIGQLATDTKKVEAPLRAAGAIVVASITKNFQAQGRPEKWKPLSPITLAMRKKGPKGKGGGRSSQILIDSADLRNSIGYRVVTGPGVEIGTNKKYARRQHFGYPGDPKAPLFSGHRPTPARPFMMIQPEDFPKIDRIFVKHISGGKVI